MGAHRPRRCSADRHGDLILDVARVWVDVSLPHLDRDFDYSVPPELAETAIPGVRVRVRFAGRLVDGFVVERTDRSDHQGALAPLVKVVSPESVLRPEIRTLVRDVADRYAGTVCDVLRAAVPPRHARVETTALTYQPGEQTVRPESGGWVNYRDGVELLDRIAAGETARAAVAVTPGDDWPAAIAVLATTALAAGRGSLVVVPDITDVQRVAAAMDVSMAGRFEMLTAGLGPAARYRAFLNISRGLVRAVIGTRAAAFAPVAELGLVVLWDDGDDLHSDPHAPYWHAREVLALRSLQTGASLVLAGHARTAEVQRLVEIGWLRSVGAARGQVRRRSAHVSVAGETGEAVGRIPQAAWRMVRDGLREGPVLVQVPRRGYLPAVACRGCRALARCTACAGPLQLSGGHAIAACRWCGRLAGDWQCPACSNDQLRAVTVGSSRTAEELGRAFPGTQVISSAGIDVRANVSDKSAIVIATPGAEPVASAGYAAALLLDAAALLGRPDLRAAEEALRRWINAVALVRSGGAVVLAGVDPGQRAVQSLVRLDPVGFASRELAERSELGLPPAARVAVLRGDADAVADLLAHSALPTGARVLGPVPDPAARTREVLDPVRMMISVPVATGPELAAALKAGAAIRSAGKAGGGVETRLDPIVLG